MPSSSRVPVVLVLVAPSLSPLSSLGASILRMWSVLVNDFGKSRGASRGICGVKDGRHSNVIAA